MVTDTERREERNDESRTACFRRYLSDHDVQLRDGVTPDKFVEKGEALAHGLSPVHEASLGTIAYTKIVEQFELIAKHTRGSLKTLGILDKHPAVRAEFEYLFLQSLHDGWVRRTYGDDVKDPSAAQRRAAESEQQRIADFLAIYPIKSIVGAIEAGSRIGARATAELLPEEHVHYPAIHRDMTITEHCADLFEELTQHRARRKSIDVGTKQEPAGPFQRFVYVICQRIDEILVEQGKEPARAHPSDPTLKHVIKHRRG